VPRGGGTIVAVSDIRGGIVNDAGLDVPAVLEYYGRKKSLEGFPGGEAITNEQLLEHPCDILCRRPTRTSSAATTLRACRQMIIVEGANGPTTQKADNIFRERGIIVVPDILANAGGVTVSYFEWVQDRAGFFWREAEVNERLEDIMVQSFNDVVEMSKKYDVSYRIAAYMLGISRVAHDTMVRGLYA
jgi:glutamate dehydrogenase (NAD(P)+)